MNDLIVYENGTALLDKKTSIEIATLEKAMKDLERVYKDYKDRIREEMAAKGIVKIDTDELTINYIAPTTRESFDSKAFRKDHREVYDAYVKIAPVSESIRITLK